MDKETLSNYGWIVILILILAVMIALATPFGNFIAGAIKSTTAGFFSVNQNAMNAGGITIPGQNFDDTPTDETPVELGCDTLYWDGNIEGLEYVVVPGVGNFEGATYYKVADYVALTESLQISNMSMYTRMDDQIQIMDMSMQEWRDILSPVSIDFEANDDGWSMFAYAIGSNGNFVHTENGDIVIPAGIWFLQEVEIIGDDVLYTHVQSIKLPGYAGFPHSEYCGH